MPSLAKKSLSLFIRNDCRRQLRLSLYTNSERKQHDMPPNQQARSSASLVGATGDDWQDQKVSEVQTIFGTQNVICAPKEPGKNRPQPTDLHSVMAQLRAFQFVVEANFSPDQFQRNFGLDSLHDEFGLPLQFSALRPDIMAVLPARADDANACQSAITGDGQIVLLNEHDKRLQLRVIDIKLASDPGAHYFAEVVYYSMALAAWLEEHGFDAQFVVTTDGTVWPGSYEKSKLSELYLRGQQGLPAAFPDLVAALNQDLEAAEFSVYVPRLLRFFRHQLPEILQTPWQQLAWHPNFRCQNCEFLGYPWPHAPGKPTHHDLHCWQIAETNDLITRVSGLSRGGALALQSTAPTVAALAVLEQNDAVWQAHPTLRSKNVLLRARAKSLCDESASAIVGTGASAAIPTYTNLKIFVSIDYDPSSAITAVMSLRASWFEPRNWNQPANAERQTMQWGDKNDRSVFIVPSRSLPDEEREFLTFLGKIKDILDWVQNADAERNEAAEEADPDHKHTLSTYQIFLWDDAQYRHLTRLMGRHLQAILQDKCLKGLAWLFPPENLIPHPDYVSRTSPISLLAPAIESHVAVPVPHHLTLLKVAEHYLPPNASTPFVDSFYQEPLTNLIPAERIHEYWNHSSRPHWRTVQDKLEKTSASKTLALALITQRLLQDAKAGLVRLAVSAAPILANAQNLDLKNSTDESLLWYQWTKLNAALAQAESEMTYALAPAEREARFKSAHLTRRLANTAEIATAIQTINASCNVQLRADRELLIYELSPLSRDVKMKVGDFNLALSPRDSDLFLNQTVRKLPHAFSYLKEEVWKRFCGKPIGEAKLTSVSLEAIDRQNLFVALRLDSQNVMPSMERKGDADFSHDVMLDNLCVDYLSSKVRNNLQTVGKPKGYAGNQAAARAMISPAPTTGRPRQEPSHDFIFFAPETSNLRVDRPTADLRRVLEAENVRLNSSQWSAWEAALTRRLSVIWGPPGTGKSQTLRAICRALVRHAQSTKTPLRVLVTANNYTAVDNVLLQLAELFQNEADVHVFRVQHAAREVDAGIAYCRGLTNILLDRGNPDQNALQLRGLLSTPSEIVIVGAPNQQIDNLAFAGDSSSFGSAKKNWFDFVVIDEASQLDAAASSLIWSKVAVGGSAVLAGDHLQLPPIYQAEPPKDLENLAGSVYSFMTGFHGIVPTSLDINYRSNATIVEFAKHAGYKNSLQSHSPDLKMNLVNSWPLNVPHDWPTNLPFVAGWSQLLDPDKPLTCFIYDDVLSGQSNEFEAQGVAALVRALWKHLGKPLNRRDENGDLLPPSVSPYDLQTFWNKGVGVVAPHRAQGSKIVDTLGLAFRGSGATPAMMRDAVDTVERFQGQERDVIIGSFGLGDPDLIASEDEFLYNLNRFNVLVSRACTKVVLLMTRSVLEHLSDDQDVVRASRLLKHFVELTCRNETPLDLAFFDQNGTRQIVSGTLRTNESSTPKCL